MKLCATLARRIALAIVVASAVAAMSPAPAEARRSTTTKKRQAVTYTSTFPNTRQGDLGSAKPTFAAFADLAAFRDSPDFQPSDRPLIRTGDRTPIGSVAYVRVRGFWSGYPSPTDPPVTLTITGPLGRRAYVRLTGGDRIVPDVFAEGADRRNPVLVGPDFLFLARPSYPLGMYTFVAASAAGRQARASFSLVVPDRPTGLRIILPTDTLPMNSSVGEPLRITWAGYPAGSQIGLLIYKAKPIAGPTRFEYEFFARFAPIPTDDNGSLEMDISTDGAAPGRYCFVTDEPNPLGCFDNTVNLH
jgi:hypothetical protein